jgi:hypothetical protein
MKARVLLCLLAAVCASPVVGQTTPPVVVPTILTVDLADAGATTTVAPGKYLVQMIDRHPSQAYTVSALVEAVQIEALDLKAITGGDGAKNKALTEVASPCDDAAKQLEDAKDEVAVRIAIAKIREAHGGQCEQLIASLTTQQLAQSYTLAKGQKLTVKVSRDARGDEKAAKSWEFVFTTGPAGSWLTHYGFSFLPNRDQKFFASGTTSPFIVTREHHRSSFDYQPTITFSWVFARFQSSSWKPVPLAGLGVDLTNPVVFVGGGFVVGDNVNVYVGVTAHKQQRLTGKYKEGDHVQDNLSADQLTEKVYRANVIFGVGFRFNGNPFKSNSSSSNSSSTGGGKSNGG